MAFIRAHEMETNEMEANAIVNRAARRGDKYGLSCYLDGRPPEEVHSLVSAVTRGYTPLLVACRNGHLEVVCYLIEVCHADIEQVGTAIIDDDVIVDASPLWCAAAAGHLSIVEALIYFNASVNSTTRDNSTPLRAACFGGNLEIVRYLVHHGADIEIANKYGHTNLMIACYKGHLRISEFLLQHKADVNKKCPKGNTALHDCAESGNLQIMKLLLHHGAVMDEDLRGITPLLSAAIIGHVAVVEYIIDSMLCSKIAQIEALELLGATFIDRKQDASRGLDFWRRAMKLRYEDTDAHLLKPSYKSTIGNYINVTEVTSFEQLDELMFDPDAMRMQNLLIRDQVLGPAHEYTAQCIQSEGLFYASAGDFDKCIQLWMYALDIQQTILEPLNLITVCSFVGFSEIFSRMSDSQVLTRIVPVVTFRAIMNVFRRALKEMKRALKHPQLLNNEREIIFHHILNVAMHLIALMCKLQSHVSKDDDFQMKKMIYKMVKMNLRGPNGWTPLHIASFKESSMFPKYRIFPSVEVVELLLEAGSCPNTKDMDGNTPLHLATMNKSSAVKPVFEALLNQGAHFDLRNTKRQTALELSASSCLQGLCPLQHVNLQCLCAGLIRHFNIPFRNIVPKSVEAFLEAH